MINYKILIIILLFSNFFEVKTETVELTDSNFENTIKEGVYFVKFYAPWCHHCIKLSGTWDLLSKNVPPHIKVARVNCVDEKKIAKKYEIQGFPTLILFKGLLKKTLKYLDGQRITDYNSSKRSLADLQAFLNSVTIPKLSTGKVVELNETNFETETTRFKSIWLVKFFAPWCGHCKALEPTWEKLAERTKGTFVHVANVDCTKESRLQSRFSIQGYPTLKLLTGNLYVDYNGERDVEKLFDFATGGWKDFDFKEKPKYVESAFNVMIIIAIFSVLFGGLCFCFIGIIYCTYEDIKPIESPTKQRERKSSLKKNSKMD